MTRGDAQLALFTRAENGFQTLHREIMETAAEGRLVYVPEVAPAKK